ncbi:MAG: 5-bromo-4-chloroindolyl phosphate hydrolysis family protein [Bacillota bacterium]
MSRRKWNGANGEFNNFNRQHSHRHSGPFIFFDLIFGIVSLAITLAMNVLGIVFDVLGSVFSSPGRNQKPPVNMNMGQPNSSKKAEDSMKYGDLSKFDTNGSTTGSTSNTQSFASSNCTAEDKSYHREEVKNPAKPQPKNEQNKENKKEAADSGSNLNILIFVLTIVPVIIFLAMKMVIYAGAAAVAGVGLMIIYNSLRGIFKSKPKQAEDNKKDSTEAAEESDTEKLIKEAFDKVYVIRKNLHKVTSQDIRSKVERLCTLAEKIIGEVRTNPENLKAVKKFFYYYLDAFNDIFNRYLRISTFNNSSEEIDKTINETEKAFDEVEDIFQELCENLIENDMLNIKATINVMKNS